MHRTMAAALAGGVDEQRGVMAEDLDAYLDIKVVEEDHGPGMMSRGANVDIGAADVLGPGPGERELLQGDIALPEHLAAGAADRQVDWVIASVPTS